VVHGYLNDAVALWVPNAYCIKQMVIDSHQLLRTQRGMSDDTRHGEQGAFRVLTDSCCSTSAEVMSVNTSAAFLATDPAQWFMHRIAHQMRDLHMCKQCCGANAPMASRSGSPTVVPSGPATRSPTAATIRLVERPGTFVFVTNICNRDSGGMSTGCGSEPIVNSTAPPATERMVVTPSQQCTPPRLNCTL
jgi:hypothetical protein